MERGQEQVTGALPLFSTPLPVGERGREEGRGVIATRWAEHKIDGRSLGRSCIRPVDVKVHNCLWLVGSAQVS